MPLGSLCLQTFVWQGVHGVYLIPSSSCPNTFSPTANGQKEIAGAAANGAFLLNTVPQKYLRIATHEARALNKQAIRSIRQNVQRMRS